MATATTYDETLHKKLQPFLTDLIRQVLKDASAYHNKSEKLKEMVATPEYVPAICRTVGMKLQAVSEVTKSTCYNKTQDLDEINTIEMNHVFANRSKEEEIFALTVNKIVAAQKADPILKHCFKRNAVLEKGVELQLVENEICICDKGRLVIPKPLQWRATI
jgi:hypothetical protein